jgi:DNA-binding CsgD family transcriptional regulator
MCILCNVLNTKDMTEQRQSVLDLHLEGLTPREIARILDLSVQRVYQQLQKLGLKANPRKDQ